jgi:peptidoglycan/LPS O-acetylase OafA/YrhL
MLESSVRTTSRIEYGLEALRGFAALVVVISHIISYGKFIDPNYFPSRLQYMYDGGHLMVLVFFVLSGFVIAISTKQSLILTTILPYVKKRLIRIYPIYWLSLMAALLVSSTSYSAFTIISNLTFVNVFFSNVILDNGPIWSLHYEILFYILFIPLSFYRLNSLIISASSVFVGLANYFLSDYINLPSLTSYCFGFAFWTAGLVVAQYFSQKENKVLNTRLLISYLFLLATLPYFNFLSILITKASYYYGGLPAFPYDDNISHWFKIAFTVLDFGYFPYCFAGVLFAINAKFKGKNALLLILQILPLFAIYIAVHYRSDVSKFIIPLCCYGLSWLFFLEIDILTKAATFFIKFLTWIGGISYGLYVFHVPLLVLFNKVAIFSGSPFSFGVRVLFYLGFSIGVAYLLEKQFQPWVKNKVLVKTKVEVISV